MTKKSKKTKRKNLNPRPADVGGNLASDVQPNIELVVGLVGPAGVDLQKITEILRDLVVRFGYEAETIRLSEELAEKSEKGKVDGKVVARYTRLMDLGDEYRERHGNDSVAKLAIPKIHEARKKRSKTHDGGFPPGRVVYIVRSLKTVEEVRFLRGVYGPAFVQISVGEAEASRYQRLCERMRREHKRPLKEYEKENIRALLDRDINDNSKKHGQNVRETFPLADLFVDMNLGVDSARTQIERFLKLVFGFQFISPTRDEWAMFVAKAAAVRSLELGRQVGAAIASPDGQLLSTGCNELPSAGGGLVWTQDLRHAEDPRDWKRGVDTNRQLSIENVVELVSRLRDQGLLDKDKVPAESDALVAEIEPMLRGIRALSLTEYGRAVHAEMAAVVDAARKGIAIQGAHLFTTTFPCHNCARHIIAAGIERVVFIEPYPKSLASAFHQEALALPGDASANGVKRVVLEPFTGIAPRIYLRVFEAEKRKEDDGSVKVWDPMSARPRQSFAAPHIAYFDRELLIVEEEIQ